MLTKQIRPGPAFPFAKPDLAEPRFDARREPKGRAQGAGRGQAASERRANDPGPTPRRTRPGIDLLRTDGALRRIGAGAETQPALDLAVTQEVDDGGGPRHHHAIREVVKKPSRAKGGRVPPERRTVSPGAKRSASPEGASPKDGTSNRSVC